MSELVSEAVTQMKIKADLENSARELLFKAELKKCKPKNVQAKAEKVISGSNRIFGSIIILYCRWLRLLLVLLLLLII